MLSVLIVAYNNLNYTTLCLQSLRRQTERGFEVVVVENGSRDEERAEGEDFKQIVLNKNYGFPFAVNLGVKACRGDWVLVLNNDCVLAPNFVEEMKKAMEKRPKLMVFSPKIYQQTNFQAPSSKLQKENKTLYACGDDIDEKGLARNIGRGEIDEGQFDSQKTVPLATFACILIKKEILEKFPLEESYFGYYEDVDFCLRIKKAGFQIGFVPKAICSHIGEASFKKLDNLDNEMRQFRNLSLTVIRNFPLSNIVRHYLIFNLKSLKYYLFMKRKLAFLRIEILILSQFINRILC